MPKMDLTLKADRAESIAMLKNHFPDEADAIDRFYDLMYTFCNEWVAVSVMNDPSASPEKYPTYFRYALKSAQVVFDEFFTNPLLQTAIGIYWSYVGMPPKTLPFAEFAIVLWAYTEFKPWHLKGGSQALSNALLNRFLEKGGKAQFNCGVRQIRVEGGKAMGVITDDGDEIDASRIISNAGMQKTYIDLIETDKVPVE